MSLLDYVRLYDIEDDNFCDSVVREYSTYEWEKHVWGHNDGKTHHAEDDKAEILYPEKNLVFDICDKVFADYSQHFNIGLVGFYPPRISRYPEGSYLRSHHDHNKDIFDGERKGIPICTAVGLLNDDFEGGNFLVSNEDIEMEKGHVVVFPSIFLYPHEVKRVTKGTRYSFVSWAW